MNGELILTAYTYDQGRIAINDSFSGAANFSTLSATTFYSAGTDLYSIFLTTADGNDITRVQPGSNITTGGTGNNPIINIVSSPSFNSITTSGASNFSTLSATTFYSGNTNLYNIFSTTEMSGGTSGSLWSAGSGSNSIILNNNSFNEASGGSSISMGYYSQANGSWALAQNFYTKALGDGSHAGGFGLLAVDDYFLIASGTGAFIHSTITNSSNHGAYADYSVILGGKNNDINNNAIGAVILGMSGFSATTAYFTNVANLYTDGVVDYKELTSLPNAKIGRTFFSGSPLFRLMVCTGATSADWMTIV